MSTTIQTPLGRERTNASNGALSTQGMLDVNAAAYQAFWLLRIGFTVAPILFGIDKFFNWSVYWPSYLAPWINNIVPGNAQDFMHVVGVVEIAAGLLVAFAPRIGAFVVAGWLFARRRVQPSGRWFSAGCEENRCASARLRLHSEGPASCRALIRIIDGCSGLHEKAARRRLPNARWSSL